MSVDDEKGNKHYIYGDSFASAALQEILSKVNEMEAYYAEKEGNIQ